VRKQRHLAYAQCPVEATLDVIGGKWKGVILFLLTGGKMRFSDLQRRLEKVTQRTLTNQLRQLEKDGLIAREVFAVVPPKVEYQLTELGQSLLPLLLDMKRWGETNLLASTGA